MRGVSDKVLRRMIFEGLATGHHMNDVEESGLRIVAHAIRRNHAVVPVVAADKTLTIERVRRPCGQHRAVALGPYDRKSAVVSAPQDLERLAAADEIILNGIEREQHADAAVEIRVQDHHVAVA
jgi:ribosomal protein L15E